MIANRPAAIVPNAIISSATATYSSCTSATRVRRTTRTASTPDWIDAIHAQLDEVEAHEGPAALVTTATGKFYTQRSRHRLDLRQPRQVCTGTSTGCTRIFTRLLTFPMATVAAVQGHAFGAGAMLATSHDFRVMRADRGFYCLPEVSLNMPFTVGMNALLNDRACPSRPRSRR